MKVQLMVEYDMEKGTLEYKHSDGVHAFFLYGLLDAVRYTMMTTNMQPKEVSPILMAKPTLLRHQ